MARHDKTRRAVVETTCFRSQVDPVCDPTSMTDGQKGTSPAAAADRMLSEAEKLGCTYPVMGLMLATPLVDDVAAVRAIISKRNAEAGHLFATATDFHWSFFVTCADDPDDGRLMAMH